jgi:chorismate dehydratase
MPPNSQLSNWLKSFTTNPRRAPQNRVCYTQAAGRSRKSKSKGPLSESGRYTNSVSKLRISVVQYLNTAPLVRGFTHGPLRGKYNLSFTVPSQCAEALRGGAADVAIIPAIEYPRIVSQGIGLTILPGLAIASKERVRSLLLLAKVPIRQARRIALDGSSRSTQALVKILAARRWRIAPEFFEIDPDPTSMLIDADAALIIGDAALRIAIAAEMHMAPGPDGEWLSTGATAGISGLGALHIYDVVKEWWHLTEKPAVLAVWAAPNEIATSELAEDFLASRDFGLRQIPEICAEAAQQMRLPERDLHVYLEKNIDYGLDEENLQGLLSFFQYSQALNLIGPLQSIAIAAGPNSHARFMDFTYARNTASSRA